MEMDKSTKERRSSMTQSKEDDVKVLTTALEESNNALKALEIPDKIINKLVAVALTNNVTEADYQEAKMVIENSSMYDDASVFVASIVCTRWQAKKYYGPDSSFMSNLQYTRRE
jgi:hypothetical protein